MKFTERTKVLLAQISRGTEMTRRDKLELAVWLSVPAVVAQFSSIVMQYIDASMVGSLGAEASASIGIVSTTTWLFSGLCAACSTGFSVQVAHKIGADDLHSARRILRQAFTCHRGAPRRFYHSGQLLCHHGREPLLYARLGNI